MTDTTNTEPTQEINASEVNAQATEATVAENATVQPEAKVEEAPTPEPVPETPADKTLPWEPTQEMVDAGKDFIAKCGADNIIPHPRGVYQTMFAAYQGE